jgi:hypothetical protein
LSLATFFESGGYSSSACFNGFAFENYIVRTFGNFLQDMTNRKLTSSHQKRDTVKCECGKEILLLPDVKEMDHAIEAHIVAVHMQKSKNSEFAAAEAERIRDALIVQVLRKASESKK